MKNNVIHIIDDINPKLGSKDLVVNISNENKKYKNSINLLKLFEENQELLKQELLNFTSLVYSKININDEDKKYLLCGLFFEKSPYKSENIFLFYKLNLLTKYIQNNNISEVYLYSSDVNIIKFFTKYCLSMKIEFHSKGNVLNKFSLKNYVMKNPYFSYLYKLTVEYKKISKKIAKQHQKKKKLVITYYPNYYFDNNEFISKYFADVSKELNKNYEWLFIYAADIEKIKNEEYLLSKHNFKSYNFLDSYINYSDMKDVFIKYKNLLKKFNKIDTNNLFVFNNIDYIDIFIDDWKKSLAIVLLDTLIFEKKFQNFFEHHNYNEVIYLMEYQPWEQMLNKTIQKSSKNTIIKGVTHSIIRPNLLNYFHSVDIHKNMFLPHYVGVNSEISKRIYKKNGFNENKIMEIEAQRFNYLANIEITKNTHNNLLITTSIDFKETKELLETFANAYDKKIFDFIYIKAHPDLSVEDIIKNIKNFPTYKKLNGTMSEAFSLVDTVYTANSSSILLESILNKKNTITLFSLKTLPMPAVSEHPLLSIATSTDELNYIFSNLSRYNNIFDDISIDEILYLDPKLLRWKEFINVK